MMIVVAERFELFEERRPLHETKVCLLHERQGHVKTFLRKKPILQRQDIRYKPIYCKYCRGQEMRRQIMKDKIGKRKSK